MKKTWRMPSARVEKFVANEYVAACWTVACDIPNRENKGIGSDAFDSDVKHGVKECGQVSHQYLVLDANGKPVEMKETNTQGMGILDCQVYTGPDYQTRVTDLSGINPGDYIYWTSSHDSRVWHHHGSVQGSANHS
jgi:hypothetical protein